MLSFVAWSTLFYYLPEDQSPESRFYKNLHDILAFICFGINFAEATCGVASSFITIQWLRHVALSNAAMRDPPRVTIGSLLASKKLSHSCELQHLASRRNKTIYISITILLMNLPYLLSIVSNVLSIHYDFEYGLIYASFLMLHIVVSAYNPIIIIARNKDIRRYMRMGVIGIQSRISKHFSTRGRTLSLV